MDVLSHVVTLMRSGPPRSVRLECVGSWTWAFHTAPGATLHVILRGSCWLIPTDGEPVALGVGDVVLLPHGSPHRTADSATTPAPEKALPDNDFSLERHTRSVGVPTGAPPATVLLSGVYQLDRSRCHPLVNDLPEIIRVPAHLGQHTPLRTAVDLLGGELNSAATGADAARSNLLDLLVLYTLRAWYEENGTGTGWGPALNDPSISAVLCSIHNSPERPWTVETLGAQAGLSRAAFSKRFTTLVGQPPLTYLTWSRLGAAAQLLRDTDDPLGTVARKVGYTSEFAFANAFKREYGSAPGTYRRHNRSPQHT